MEKEGEADRERGWSWLSCTVAFLFFSPQLPPPAACSAQEQQCEAAWTPGKGLGAIAQSIFMLD